MPFTYEDTLQGESRNALTIQSARSDVLRAQFQQSYEENPILALKRFSDLAEDQVTGPRVSAEDARLVLKESGMENDITISDAGITRAALNTLIERKRVEKRRQEIFARSQGGLGEGAARFGVAAATTLTDPVSAALNFVPVAGQVRYARWLNAARSMAGRAGVRAGVGALEGAAGAAIAEVPIYAMRTQEQADYDMVDSLLNVALGGVVGSGLHTTVGTVGEVLARRMPSRESAPRVEPAESSSLDVQRAVDGMPPMAREAALREAVAQAAEGRPISVEHMVSARDDLVERLVTDQELRGSLDAMREETGWAEEGGRLLMDDDGRVLGRTTWIPRAEWWRDRPKGLTEDEVRMAVDKALAGQRLTKRERSMIEFMRDVADERTRLTEYLPTDREMAREGLSGADDAYETGMLARAVEVDETHVDRLADQYGNDTDGFLTAIKEFVDQNTAPATRGTSRQGAPAEKVGPASEAPDRELVAAESAADEALARDFESTAEASLRAAEEEADLAVSDATELTRRLGVDPKEDAEYAAVLEGVEKADRWARVAELATVCLMRGG
jgi:hypothetical protein